RGVRRLLRGRDLERPRALLRRERAELPERRPGADDGGRVAPRQRAGRALAARLRDPLADDVVRGLRGVVRAQERGLPAVELRLVDEAEEEDGGDRGVARGALDELAVDVRLVALGRRGDGLGARVRALRGRKRVGLPA